MKARSAGIPGGAGASASAPASPIYDEIDYIAMPDVPYELDRHSLVMMQKLERGLRYMLDNLLKHDMTMGEVAEYADYSPSYFKTAFARHFEMPFARFLMRLRMRQAARDIRSQHFPKGIPRRYGFANSASFSKAFSREIGISPRQFYKGNYDIPDMPMRKRLNGVPIALEYTVERAFTMRGALAPPPQGIQSFLMDSLALPYTGEYPQFNDILREECEVKAPPATAATPATAAALVASTVPAPPTAPTTSYDGHIARESTMLAAPAKHATSAASETLAGLATSAASETSTAFAPLASHASPAPPAASAIPTTPAMPAPPAVLAMPALPGDYVGVWNYHPETGLNYEFGPVEERHDCISVLSPALAAESGKQRVIVQGGRYAVFSYPRPRSDGDIPLMQRMLSRFVFQEWIPMNGKVANTMGFTFERFTPSRVYLYLPIVSGMDNGEKLRETRWGLASWARHIDELIGNGIDLSTEALASLEGYSEQNYIDVFSMYYGLTPLAYVRRRRLYLAGEEIRAANRAAGYADECILPGETSEFALNGAFETGWGGGRLPGWTAFCPSTILRRSNSTAACTRRSSALTLAPLLPTPPELMRAAMSDPLASTPDLMSGLTSALTSAPLPPTPTLLQELMQSKTPAPPPELALLSVLLPMLLLPAPLLPMLPQSTMSAPLPLPTLALLLSSPELMRKAVSAPLPSGPTPTLPGLTPKTSSMSVLMPGLPRMSFRRARRSTWRPTTHPTRTGWPAKPAGCERSKSWAIPWKSPMTASCHTT